ncbi:ParB/RepB/Spo0J family partition protein [Sulfitobacter sp.]|uniref:ParB/RepB/Spo0J family partition protein n=1 Tax=Sulfitobacter sp. TaxID=1903071 RepID=UPI0030016BF3
MNAHANIAETTTTVPLDSLYQHSMNPRQSHDQADIIGLAQSISTVGLLQNLSGYIDPAQIGLGIVAGGRRLAALQHIADHPSDFEGGMQIDLTQIPVINTTDPTLALSWAGAEAATQRPLHPADEIRAYGAMVDSSSDHVAIARAFGCTVAHVNRRLKLANLPDATLTALRADEITLDHAAALTLCNSPEQHTVMLETAIKHPHWHIGNLKREILTDRVNGDDRRAIFVGPDLYTMEGGTVVEDLFSDHMIFSDETLLKNLFEAKLTTAAERINAEHGYAKTIPTFETHVSYTHTQEMTRPTRVPIDLPKADASELAKLEHREADGDDMTSQEYARIQELHERTMGTYSDDDVARGVTFAYVDHKGDLQTEGPYLPRAANGNADTSADGTATQVPSKPPITQGGMDDLRRIQLLALQKKMIDKPDLMLELLAFQLSHDIPSYSATFNIQDNEQPNTPSCTDEVRIDTRLSKGGVEPLTNSPFEAFTEFKKLGKAHRNKTLALALARTLNQPWGSPINLSLMEALDVSPRDVWTPTADNHFKACSVPSMDSTWRELVIQDDEGDAEMARFQKLKKGDKAKELEALFNDTSVQEALVLSRAQIATIDAWVPVIMRGDA